MSVQAVLSGEKRWHVEAADALEFLRGLPDGSVSLVLTSPPYEAARTYGVGFKLVGQDWVDWLAAILAEACRACSGLVMLNAAGQVRNHSYSPVVEWLVADLTRRHGVVCGPAPYCYFRHGVPGSGGRHYHRRDWEPVYAFCLPDRLPLSWSDNTAMGAPPRWAPGGEMSNRLANGQRVNQWGAGVDSEGRANKGGRKNAGGSMRGREVTPSHQVLVVGEPDTTPGLFGPQEPPAEGPNVNQWGGHETTGRSTKKDGTKQPPGRPSHRKVITRPRPGQHSQESTTYSEPVLANPGSVVKELYTAEDVRQILMGGEVNGPVMQGSPGGDVVRCLVGGGLMGSRKAHESEAPFSETLCEYLIRSYCPPDGIACDIFSGSGTTGAVAVRWGRRFLGCDLRQSQVDIARERVGAETPPLPGVGV